MCLLLWQVKPDPVVLVADMGRNLETCPKLAVFAFAPGFTRNVNAGLPALLRLTVPTTSTLSVGGA